MRYFIIIICLIPALLAGQTTVQDTLAQNDSLGVWFVPGSDLNFSSNELKFGETSGDRTMGNILVSVSVPQGATILSAIFYHFGNDSYGSPLDDTTNIVVLAEDTDNAAVFTSDTTTFKTRMANVMTDSSKFEPYDTLQFNALDSIDITTTIQGVVDRVGWSSGNNIGLYWLKLASSRDSHNMGIWDSPYDSGSKASYYKIVYLEDDYLFVPADSIDDTYMQFGNDAINNLGSCDRIWIGQHSDSGTVDCRDSPPQNIMRGLISFPVYVPAGQVIDSAFLNLYLYAVSKYASCTFTDSTHFVVHASRRDWGEGAQCAAEQATGECSWTSSIHDTQDWTTPGAGNTSSDIYQSAETDTIGLANTDVDIWVNVPITKIIDKIYTGAQTNYGIMIRALEDQMGDSTQIGLYQFRSTEGDSVPNATIYYTPAAAVKKRVIFINE